MRISRAIDKFLRWRELERDATPQSVQTYWRILSRVFDDNEERLHDYEGRAGTEKLRAKIGKTWGRRSASTRSHVISIVRSFFDWAEDEDLIATNPARRIRRPPTRNPDIYRPTETELTLIRRAANDWERPAILLLEGLGLRASEVCSVRWSDVDLTEGRLRVLRKGRKRQTMPIGGDVLNELRACHRAINPEPDWHVFTVKVKRWANATHRVETVRDPTQPAGRNSLGYLVDRVCKRAGVRHLGPHQLRHGYASRLRRGGASVDVIQWLLAHEHLATTERYLDAMRLEEIEAELARIFAVETTEHQDLATAGAGASGDQYTFPPAADEATGESKHLGPDPGESEVTSA